MKSTVVDESLSSFKTNVLFQRIPSFYKMAPMVLKCVGRCLLMGLLFSVTGGILKSACKCFLGGTHSTVQMGVTSFSVEVLLEQ